MLVDVTTARMLAAADEHQPPASGALTAERRETIESVVADQVERLFLPPDRPKKQRVSGGSVERYEKPLAEALLQAQPHRPIPPDLDEALKERFGAS